MPTITHDRARLLQAVLPSLSLTLHGLYQLQRTSGISMTRLREDARSLISQHVGPSHEHPNDVRNLSKMLQYCTGSLPDLVDISHSLPHLKQGIEACLRAKRVALRLVDISDLGLTGANKEMAERSRRKRTQAENDAAAASQRRRRAAAGSIEAPIVIVRPDEASAAFKAASAKLASEGSAAIEAEAERQRARAFKDLGFKLTIDPAAQAISDAADAKLLAEQKAKPSMFD